MKKIKVCLADSSALGRKKLYDILREDEDIKVVGQLQNCDELIVKMFTHTPDIVIVSEDGRELNGQIVVDGLRRVGYSKKIVILGDNKELNIIDSENTVSLMNPIDKNNNIDKDNKANLLKWIRNSQKKRTKINQTEESIFLKDKFNMENKRYKINKNINAILIGASTGGPNSIYTVLKDIKSDIKVPIIIVQHMPKNFTKSFADRLDKNLEKTVKEASDKMPIGNDIYIAPGGYHLTIGKDKKFLLEDSEPIWGVKPAVDKLFISAAKVFNGNVLSIILTGMGRDGANGTGVIKEYGGITIAQDEETSVIYGMPKAAIETGKVDYVVALNKIGDLINSILK